jgi:hypothetical protein
VLQITGIPVPFVRTVSKYSRGMFVVIFMVCLTEAWGQDRRTMDLCDILANLGSFNGKEVVVRGEQVYSEHGEWLVAAQPCPKKLITDRFVWNDVIHLVEDKTQRLDIRSLAERAMAIERAQSEKTKQKIIVTLVGTLKANVPPIVVHYPDGSMTGGGFGHLNRAPAELVYRRVSRVEIERRAEASRPGT